MNITTQGRQALDDDVGCRGSRSSRPSPDRSAVLLRALAGQADVGDVRDWASGHVEPRLAPARRALVPTNSSVNS